MIIIFKNKRETEREREKSKKENVTIPVHNGIMESWNQILSKSFLLCIHQ